MGIQVFSKRYITSKQREGMCSGSQREPADSRFCKPSQIAYRQIRATWLGLGPLMFESLVGCYGLFLCCTNIPPSLGVLACYEDVRERVL